MHGDVQHVAVLSQEAALSDAGDADLVLRAKAGDTAAFEILAKRHVRTVLGLIRQRCNDKHATEDAAQQALFQAFQSLHQLQEPELFGAWLYRIALRVAVRRVQQTCREVPLAHASESASTTCIDDPPAERQQAVRDAVGELMEPYRLVVTLKYLEGMDAAEIGRRLGIPHGTVRAQLSRALPMLREKLRRYL